MIFFQKKFITTGGYNETFITNITKMSLNEGVGIRTCVELKGCKLRCEWCNNPFSIPFFEQKIWNKEKCISCENCVKNCPENAIVIEDNIIKINENKCKKCYLCVENCLVNAYEIKGKEYEADKLINIILKDKAFYDASGGGVTLLEGKQYYILNFFMK